MQGFAITTGRPVDERVGSLVLHHLAMPFTKFTGKSPQLLARFIFSLTCLFWIAGPALGGGYRKDILGNGVQMLFTLLLLWLGLRLSWQIEGLARGCDGDKVPMDLLITGHRFARNRWIWGALLLVEGFLYASSRFSSTDLFNMVGQAFLVVGSYVVTCVVIPQPRKKKARAPLRFAVPSFARVQS